MESTHRQNAAEAAAEILTLQTEVRRALRAANTSLATAFAVARRKGDLVETARIAGAPLALAERLAAWADLTIVTAHPADHPSTMPLNMAHRRADAQAKQAAQVTYEDSAEDPGAVAVGRIVHYANVREIDLAELVNTIGSIGPNPGLVELSQYADALKVPIQYLVGGRVDDTPMPV